MMLISNVIKADGQDQGYPLFMGVIGVACVDDTCSVKRISERIAAMNLGHSIASEFGVNLHHVMLLRHSNSKVKALQRAGASVEEYTFVQPTNSPYDYPAEGMPEIRIVVPIVNDRVQGAYKVLGIQKTGTTRSLVSPQFRKFDIDQRYPEKDAKLYRLEKIETKFAGKAVLGWRSPRHAVARYGHKLFETVEAV